MSDNDDDLFGSDFFAPEEELVPTPQLTPINVLVIDDEQEIHTVARLALNDFDYHGRKLNFTNAYSAEEAKTLLQNGVEYAVALIDVVMESDHAGLELVRWIRENLKNQAIRLVLRTGQPGQAPERQVIKDYDINDYKAKTELTTQKLFTLMYTALRAYDHIVLLERNKLGMERVIEATKNIIGKVGLMQFLQATLDQLTLLLEVENAIVISVEHYEAPLENTSIEVVGTTGTFTSPPSPAHLSDLPFATLALNAIREKSAQFEEHELLLICQNRYSSALFYAENTQHLSDLDRHLLSIFTENVSIALENTSLNEQLRDSQREVIYRLGEVVEYRSKETGNHVKRVAKYSHLLAQLYGLDDEHCELIFLASPLHDIGKVGIPDAILHKPGKLDADEWQVMQSHALSGATILAGSKQVLLDTGAKIAGTHHERWDGKGYPQGLAGEAIPIEGRITALADIFDALNAKRCYKDPWPIEEVLKFIEQESGNIFEPRLVELMMANLTQFLAIKDAYQD